MSNRREKKQWLDLRIFQRSLKEIKTTSPSTEDSAFAKIANLSDDTDTSGGCKRGSYKSTGVSLKPQVSPKKRRSTGRGFRNGERYRPIERRNVRGSHSSQRESESKSETGSGKNGINNVTAESKQLIETIPFQSNASDSKFKGLETAKDHSLDEDWSKELIEIPGTESEPVDIETTHETYSIEKTTDKQEDQKSESCETPDDVKEFFQICGEHSEGRSTLLGPLQSTPIKNMKPETNMENNEENQDSSFKKQTVEKKDKCIIDVDCVLKQKMELSEDNSCCTYDNEVNTNKFVESQDVEQSVKSETINDNTILKTDHQNLHIKSEDVHMKSYGPRVVDKSRRGGFSRGSQGTRFPTPPLPSYKLNYRNRGRGRRPSRNPSEISCRVHRSRSVEMVNSGDIPPRFRNTVDRGQFRPTHVYYGPVKKPKPLLQEEMHYTLHETKDKMIDKSNIWVLPTSEDWVSELDEDEILDNVDDLCFESHENLNKKDAYHEANENDIKKESLTDAAVERDLVPEVQDDVQPPVLALTTEPYLPPPPPVSGDELDITQEDILEEDPFGCGLKIDDQMVNTKKKLENKMIYVFENDSDSQQYSDTGLYVCNPDFSEMEIPDSDPISQEHLEIDFGDFKSYESSGNSQGQEVPNLQRSSYERNRLYGKGNHTQNLPEQNPNLSDQNMLRPHNQTYQWYDYYSNDPYIEWYRKHMQYYDWLSYQHRCYGQFCPDEWERAEHYRQYGYSWQRSDFPQPYSCAAELEQRPKTYQEQRISDFWQDRMPNWVKCQEATVQTSPSLSHIHDKNQTSMKNNRQNKQSNDKMSQKQSVPTDFPPTTTLTIQNEDSRVDPPGDLLVDTGIRREDKIEALNDDKRETKRHKSDGTASMSVGEKGDCTCKEEEVKYLVWRMCNCPAGNPPKLHKILHNGQEELSQDLGYHSVDSIDESGLYSHQYLKLVPSVPSASSTPMIKKEIGQLEKSMLDLGLTPITSLSKKLSSDGLKPPPGFQPMVYPLTRGGRFSVPERQAPSSSSSMKKHVDNTDRCHKTVDLTDIDMCNNNMPRCVVNQKSGKHDSHIESDVNNNKSCMLIRDHKITKLTGDSHDSLALPGAGCNQDDKSSRGSLRSVPSQESSFMELPSSLTCTDVPMPATARSNTGSAGGGDRAILSALHTYNKAIQAIGKTLQASQKNCKYSHGNLNTLQEYDPECMDQLDSPILQSVMMEHDQKVNSDSSPKSGEEETSSVCDADNESDVSLDKHVVRLAVSAGVDMNSVEKPHTQQSRMISTGVSYSHQLSNTQYPPGVETRQTYIPSTIRPRSHFLRDSPMPRFNYNQRREEFPFYSPFHSSQVFPFSQERAELLGSEDVSSECSVRSSPVLPTRPPYKLEPKDKLGPSRYGQDGPVKHGLTAASVGGQIKVKHFPKLVDYGLTEDSSNDSEDQEQDGSKQTKADIEEKETVGEGKLGQKPTGVPTHIRYSSDIVYEKSATKPWHRFDTGESTDQTPPHPYLTSRRLKPRQKALKSFTASDPSFSQLSFSSKKRNIEDTLDDEGGRGDDCSKITQVTSTADTSRSMSSLFSRGDSLPPLPPLPPFPNSPFWGMYMPNNSSALTGKEKTPPQSYSAAVNAGLSSPARRVFNNKHLRKSWPMSPSFTQSQSESDSDKITPYLSDWKKEFKSVHNFGVKYVDTHCHLDFLFTREGFSGNLADYMAEHPETFPDMFEGCVAVFCNPASFNPNKGLWLEVAEEKNVWIAMGCHPKMVTMFNKAAEWGLRKCLQHSKCIALGEIGLDYSGKFYQFEEEQKRAFRKQLEMAIEMNKPLVIHCRDAERDCLAIMKQIVPRDYKIHCHCFTLGYANARLWLDAFTNLYIGITPLVTYSTATPSHDLARNIPLNKLLLETDAPYFIPRCIPKHEMPLSNPGVAVTVAREVAKHQEVPVAAVLRHCRLNTKFMYGI